MEEHGKEEKYEMEKKEEKDRRLVILEVPLDLSVEMNNGVVPIQLRPILALWPAFDEHFLRFLFD